MDRPLTGAWADYPSRPFVGLRLGGVFRYLIYGVLLVACLMFYVWSRVDVRRSAALLETAQLDYAELLSQNDRLLLELASRRDLATVGLAGAQMELADDVTVVQVSAP